MSTEKLPDGWTRVSFGDVVRNSNENSRDLKADGIDRVVGLEHLDPGLLRLVRWDHLADLPDGTTFTRKFKPGQVLFGKRRAYQRKVAVPDFDGVCSGDILVFEPADKRMLTEFLPYVVQSDGFFDHALGTSAGSLSPRTKWAELAKYEFALPPLDEQQRIVEILTAVDAHVSSLERQGAAARTARSAVLSELLSAGGDDWTETTLGAVAAASWGNTSVTKKQYKESGFTAFSASGPDGFVDWFEHEGEGVVLSAIGALCGKTWLADGKWTPIKNTIWIKSKSEGCLTEFLYLLTKTPDLWPIRGQAQPFISLGDVLQVGVSLPPLAVQKRIVEVVSSMDCVIHSTQLAVAETKNLRLGLLSVLLAGEGA